MSQSRFTNAENYLDEMQKIITSKPDSDSDSEAYIDLEKIGATALHLLAEEENFSEDQYESVIELFLKQGGKIDQSCEWPYDPDGDYDFAFGGTALHHCFEVDPMNFSLAALLIKHGASLDCTISRSKNKKLECLKSSLTTQEEIKPLELGELILRKQEARVNEMVSSVDPASHQLAFNRFGIFNDAHFKPDMFSKMIEQRKKFKDFTEVLKTQPKLFVN